MASPVIAVTGGTGFVGSHIVQALAKAGYRPRLLTRRTPIHPFFRDLALDAVIGDLSDPQARAALVENCAGIIHVAGLTKAVGRDAFMAINRDATAALIETVNRHASGTPFVHVSSLAARHPTVSPYAASKQAGEEVLRTQAQFPWTVIRPPAVYGPGDQEFLPLFRTMCRGFLVRVGPRAARLSFIHAQDLAVAVVAALKSMPALKNSVYEIDDGRPGGYDWATIQQSAAAAFDRKLTMIGVPWIILWLTAGFRETNAHITGKADILTLGKLGEIRHTDWVVKENNFNNITGFVPKYDLASGFRQTLDWYRRQEWLSPRP